MKYYPKVLIIGETFHQNSGGGITISNLFKGWPVDNIAVANFRVFPEEDSICKNYYRLGLSESSRVWPFNFFREDKPSGPVNYANQREKMSSVISIRESKINPKDIITELLKFVGLYYFINKLKISKQFEEWVKEYSPEVIYSQLASLELIKFVKEVSAFTNANIAVHIMDDWIKTEIKRGPIKFYLQRILEKELKSVFAKATVLMGISQSMCTEYERRYQKKFIPFHNPLEIDKWEKYTKTNFKMKDTFKILYAGRIGIGMAHSIIDIAKAVEVLFNEGLKICFEVQSTYSKINMQKELEQYKCVKLSKPIAYEKLPEKFASADVLALPIDFSSESLRFMKYSMPTKTTEYMISGTPILVYASQETALYQYAEKYGWGFVVSKRDIEQIAGALRTLYKNESLREKLSRCAVSLAKKEHDAIKVRNDFRYTLSFGSSEKTAVKMRNKNLTRFHYKEA